MTDIDKDSITAFAKGWKEAGRDGAIDPKLAAALLDTYGIHPDRAQQFMNARMDFRQGRGPEPDPKDYASPVIVDLGEVRSAAAKKSPEVQKLTNSYASNAANTAQAAPPRKRIISDCNGTLFLARANEATNMQLLTFLSLAKQTGFDVVIASNDATGNEQALKLLSLKYFGDAAYFGDVKHKSEYSGVDAFMVFDDDHSSHAIRGQNLFSPTDSALLQRLNEQLLTLLGDRPTHFKRGGPVISYDPS
jgi:hypothetical protein